MSMRLSPTAYRTVCGTGSSWCSPSRRAATRWSNAAAGLRNGNRDAAVPDRQLDQRAAGLAREVAVERDVGGHFRRPLLVALREGFVPADAPMLRAPRIDSAPATTDDTRGGQ